MGRGRGSGEGGRRGNGGGDGGRGIDENEILSVGAWIMVHGVNDQTEDRRQEASGSRQEVHQFKHDRRKHSTDVK